VALLEGDEMPHTGSLLIGTEGVMVVPHDETRPVLHPAAKFKDFQWPQVKGVHHWRQFVDACRGGDKTTANFDYAGPLTEAILLGDIASRFPQTTLAWNARRMKFDLREADHFIQREYRAGWAVKGLG